MILFGDRPSWYSNTRFSTGDATFEISLVPKIGARVICRRTSLLSSKLFPRLVRQHHVYSDAIHLDEEQSRVDDRHKHDHKCFPRPVAVNNVHELHVDKRPFQDQPRQRESYGLGHHA